MKKLSIVGLVVLGILPGFLAGLAVGHSQGGFRMALEENKLAAWNLKYHGEKLSPQLREYLKTRIYCNVLVRYPKDSGYLRQQDWDFGPVDREILGEIATYKDLFKAWNWEEAVAGK